ncbi:MAG: TetR/AcrR family transcriptional regulator [Nocardioides sp.]|uniref:TetR/AcrR family transcriptional regulator n=1 Tax=Nocardioides sp. TaxID=35761 RepID=UPI0039E5F6BB
MLRADARRNRDQIISAAAGMFATAGLDVPMEAIARAAGVGVGTLYRRFPDRSELVAAVAGQGFRTLLEELRVARETETSAWAVLVRIITESESLRLTVHLAFLSPLSWTAVHGATLSRGAHEELMAVLDHLVRDAQAEGSIRSDIGSGDALSLLSLILGARPPDSDPVGQLRTQRSLWLVLDGLRATPGSPLPGEPVSVGDLSIGAARTGAP